MVIDWCIDYLEYVARIKVIPKKDYPVLMLFYFREFGYSRRGWENNFLDVGLEPCAVCCGVDLRASINGLSRNLEVFERR